MSYVSEAALGELVPLVTPSISVACGSNTNGEDENENDNFVTSPAPYKDPHDVAALLSVVVPPPP
jgi:hypothetical protein